MKAKLVPVLVLTLMLALTACSSASTPTLTPDPTVGLPLANATATPTILAAPTVTLVPIATLILVVTPTASHAPSAPLLTPTLSAPPGTPQPAPTAAQASALLLRAISQAKTASTFRFTNEVYNNDVLFNRSTGVFAAPEQIQMTQQDTQGVERERVIANGKAYIRVKDGQWQVQAFPSSQTTSPLGRLVDQYLGAWLLSPQVVGQTELSGVKVIYLRATSDLVARGLDLWPVDPPLPPGISPEQAEQLKAQLLEQFALQREQYAAGRETIELWIGVNDGHIYQANVELRLPAHKGIPGASTKNTIRFADFGAALVVTIPTVNS